MACYRRRWRSKPDYAEAHSNLIFRSPYDFGGGGESYVRRKQVDDGAGTYAAMARKRTLGLMQARTIHTRAQTPERRLRGSGFRLSARTSAAFGLLTLPSGPLIPPQ